MPKIFALYNDGLRYQEPDFFISDVYKYRPDNLDESLVSRFSESNIAMADWWPTPDIQFNNIESEGELPIPDLCSWLNGSLVLSARAYRFLGELLGQWGELLPITIRGEEGSYIFNCLTFGEADAEQCEKEYFEGEEVGIKKIVFNESDIKSKVIFKTKYNYCNGLFCNETLKTTIEKFELTGMICLEELAPNYSGEAFN